MFVVGIAGGVVEALTIQHKSLEFEISNRPPVIQCYLLKGLFLPRNFHDHPESHHHCLSVGRIWWT